MRFLQELLKFVGLEGRLHLEWISSAEAQKFVQVVTEFTEKIKALGPSPLSSLNERIKDSGPSRFPDPGKKIKVMSPREATDFSEKKIQGPGATV